MKTSASRIFVLGAISCLLATGVSAFAASNIVVGAAIDFSWDQQRNPDISERYGYSPLMQFAWYPANASEGWALHWEKDDAVACVALRLGMGPHLVFNAGPLCGVSRGRFRAYNEGFSTLESWETHWGFAWGGRAGVELHRDAQSGPYLESVVSSINSRAGEASEYLSGPNKPGGEEPNGDVTFDWSENTWRTMAGWRLRWLSPALGVQSSWLNVHKKIVAHYPDDGNYITEVLNSAPAEYRYEDNQSLVAFAEVTAQPCKRTTLGCRANLTGEQSYAVSLGLTF